MPPSTSSSSLSVSTTSRASSGYGVDAAGGQDAARAHVRREVLAVLVLAPALGPADRRHLQAQPLALARAAAGAVPEWEERAVITFGDDAVLRVDFFSFFMRPTLC